MIAYKGFNKDLTCTMGHGTFQYEIGKTYEEEKAQCANTGFHCVEEPIETIRWYGDKSSRYCIVEASGDINEDGNNKISCTRMTIIKEVSREQIGALECEWIIAHPYRDYSHLVKKESGIASSGDIVVVRGKNPKAAGEKNSTVFLLKEDRKGNIIKAAAFRIDGILFKTNTYYNVDEKEAVCRKKS